ncbi:MAG: hypothetical protein II508_07245 [Acholeplasmatales bacterium]|nr:hypothetical protein [Acholeplasmatales bacterium]
MEEKEKKPSWLEKIDQKAEDKGKTVKTLWQIANLPSFVHSLQEFSFY